MVTGASAGLGRRLALDLARAGAVVIGVARREDRLAALAEEMASFSPRSGYRVCDLADTDAFVTLLGAVEDTHGSVDVLCNVAGIGGVLRHDPVTIDTVRQMIGVNFITPAAGMLAVLPAMRARRWGAVVNVSSDDERAPGPGAGDYAASKAALAALTESLSFEARTDGVHLHVLYPGWMPTETGQRAVHEGGMRLPPRPVRRTEARVSALVLRRLDHPAFEINAAALPLVAPVFRTLAPRTYQRARARQ